MSELTLTSSPMQVIVDALQASADGNSFDKNGFIIVPYQQIGRLSLAVAQLLMTTKTSPLTLIENACQLLANKTTCQYILDAVEEIVRGNSKEENTSDKGETAARFLQELTAVVIGEQILLAAEEKADQELRIRIPQMIQALQGASGADAIRDEELAPFNVRGGKSSDMAADYFAAIAGRPEVAHNPQAFRQAWIWLQRRLQLLESPAMAEHAEPPSSLKARIVRANEIAGELGWLHVTRYEAERSGCYVEPQMFCYLRDNLFEGAARKGWEEAQSFVRDENNRRFFAHLSSEEITQRLATTELRWRVEMGTGRDMLRDKSIGAAMAVAFVSALTDLPYHSETLLTAKIVDHGNFAPIDFTDKKAKAAIAHKDPSGRSYIQQILVHNYQQGFDTSDYVEKIAGIAAALVVTSGRLQGILQFLREEADVVLRDARSRIGNSIESVATLEHLFVPVRVARGLRPKLADYEYREIERSHAAGERDAWNRTVQRRLSFREEEFNQGTPGTPKRTGSIPTRITEDWDAIREEKGGRFVVLGDPGFGKTTLFWRELYRRNAEAESQLRAGTTHMDAMQFAVFVRAAELAHVAARKPQPNQQELLGYLYTRHSITEEWMRTWLKTAIQDGRCLVLLDGYDEMDSQQRDAFNKTVEDLKSVYLSSRLAGYARSPFAVNGSNEVEILAYSYPQKVEEAVRKWFRKTPDDAERLWSYIQAQTGFQWMLCNPLLLRFACDAAAREFRAGRVELTWQNRTDLFHSFVENLLTQAKEGLEHEPDTQKIAPRRFQTLDTSGLRRLFEYLAMQLWRDDPQRSLFERRHLENVYYKVIEQNDPIIRTLQMNIHAIVPPFGCDDLYPIGILVPTYNGPGSPAMFNLRSLGEYLAACGFKEALEGGGHSETECNQLYAELDRLAWLPDAQPVFLFLSGILDNPVRLIETVRKSKEEDDLGRHRLSLALRCVVEASQRLSN